MEEVHRQLYTVRASPGSDEAALFDKLISIIIDEREASDKLIFDTAPTGHTIRLLSLAELMGVWIEGMLSKRYKRKEDNTDSLNKGDPFKIPIMDELTNEKKSYSTSVKI